MHVFVSIEIHSYVFRHVSCGQEGLWGKWDSLTLCYYAMTSVIAVCVCVCAGIFLVFLIQPGTPQRPLMVKRRQCRLGIPFWI